MGVPGLPVGRGCPWECSHLPASLPHPIPGQIWRAETAATWCRPRRLVWRAWSWSCLPMPITRATPLGARSWPGWRMWPPLQPGEGRMYCLCLPSFLLLLPLATSLWRGNLSLGFRSLAVPNQIKNFCELTISCSTQKALIFYVGNNSSLGLALDPPLDLALPVLLLVSMFPSHQAICCSVLPSSTFPAPAFAPGVGSCCVFPTLLCLLISCPLPP